MGAQATEIGRILTIEFTTVSLDLQWSFLYSRLQRLLRVYFFSKITMYDVDQATLIPKKYRIYQGSWLGSMEVDNSIQPTPTEHYPCQLYHPHHEVNTQTHSRVPIEYSVQLHPLIIWTCKPGLGSFPIAFFLYSLSPDLSSHC